MSIKIDDFVSVCNGYVAREINIINYMIANNVYGCEPEQVVKVDGFNETKFAQVKVDLVDIFYVN